ncbi:MAG: sugar transferase [Bacteroidia bacterium]|nr:sugar transferase [Bacteroidia bacterium]
MDAAKKLINPTQTLIFIGEEVKKLIPLFKDEFQCFYSQDHDEVLEKLSTWGTDDEKHLGIITHPFDLDLDEWKTIEPYVCNQKNIKMILLIESSLRKDAKELREIYKCADFVLANDDKLYLSVSIKEKLAGRIDPHEYFKSGRKIHPIKRAFDILVAGTALLLLSPFLLIIALLIKLESKGPIFYISKRIGMNYQVFDFYKLRSMRVNADKMLDQLKDQNSYAKEEEKLEAHMEDFFNGVDLIGDQGIVDEGGYEFVQENSESSFVKVVDDPRITRVGKFIRNTSVDELPQLLNVLKGDMSLVGNRPLPLYEAEKLTSDQWVERFMAPAGITGLWQVTERGKSGVSEEGRMKLDITYARNYSLWMDLKIIFMTLPAMFQHENV